jgi:hypothetical protein
MPYRIRIVLHLQYTVLIKVVLIPEEKWFWILLLFYSVLRCFPINVKSTSERNYWVTFIVSLLMKANEKLTLFWHQIIASLNELRQRRYKQYQVYLNFH